MTLSFHKKLGLQPLQSAHWWLGCVNAIIVPQQMQTWKRDSHNLVKEWLTNVETTYFEHERYFWKEYYLDWLGYVFTQLQLFQKDDFCWLDTGSRGQRGEDTANDCDKRL